MYEGFGDPACDISRRSVDFRVVLSRESSSAVSSPASVGIDDDLSAGQAGVTLRAANDEKARGLDLDM